MELVLTEFASICDGPTDDLICICYGCEKVRKTGSCPYLGYNPCYAAALGKKEYGCEGHVAECRGEVQVQDNVMYIVK